MQLIGGDTTRGPHDDARYSWPLCQPWSGAETFWRKNRATGFMLRTLGDSAAGLAILRVMRAGDADHSVKRHLRPTPRIYKDRRYAISPVRRRSFRRFDLDLGPAIRVSQHRGARIDFRSAARIPKNCVLRQYPEQPLDASGGEDCELCLPSRS